MSIFLQKPDLFVLKSGCEREVAQYTQCSSIMHMENIGMQESTLLGCCFFCFFFLFCFVLLFFFFVFFFCGRFGVGERVGLEAEKQIFRTLPF